MANGGADSFIVPDKRVRNQRSDGKIFLNGPQRMDRGPEAHDLADTKTREMVGGGDGDVEIV